LLLDRYASSAVTLDGFIYLVGGQGTDDTALQRYDPAADKWTRLAPLSMRRDHTVAVALEGKIWALGGRLGVGSAFDTVEVYDPATDTWSAGPSMLDTRSGFGAAVIDGRIYAAGGEILIQPVFVRDTAEVYDPATKQWSYKAKLPTPLHGTGAGAWDGKFGGASMAQAASPRTGVVHILTP
jgi:N-acetylneuraminic acid mutarotase